MLFYIRGENNYRLRILISSYTWS